MNLKTEICSNFLWSTGFCSPRNYYREITRTLMKITVLQKKYKVNIFLKTNYNLIGNVFWGSPNHVRPTVRQVCHRPNVVRTMRCSFFLVYFSEGRNFLWTFSNRNVQYCPSSPVVRFPEHTRTYMCIYIFGMEISQHAKLLLTY